MPKYIIGHFILAILTKTVYSWSYGPTGTTYLRYGYADQNSGSVYYPAYRYTDYSPLAGDTVKPPDLYKTFDYWDDTISSAADFTEKSVDRSHYGDVSGRSMLDELNDKTDRSNREAEARPNGGEVAVSTVPTVSTVAKPNDGDALEESPEPRTAMISKLARSVSKLLDDATDLFEEAVSATGDDISLRQYYGPKKSRISLVISDISDVFRNFLNILTLGLGDIIHLIHWIFNFPGFGIINFLQRTLHSVYKLIMLLPQLIEDILFPRTVPIFPSLPTYIWG